MKSALQTKYSKNLNSILSFIGFKSIALSFFAFLLFLGTNEMNGQTYYSMSSGNYSQTFTGFSNAYPTNFNGLAVSAVGSIPVATKITTATNAALGVSSASSGIGYDAIVANSSKLIFLTTGTADNSAAVGCDLNLDFTGRIAGSLSFNYATIFNTAVASGRAASFVVYYSVDGTSWSQLSATYTVYNTTGSSTANIPVSITLPSALNNQATVKFRFYEYNGGTVVGTPSGSRPKISLDDIVVTSSSAVPIPTINGAANTTAFTTTYGTASAVQTFSISGSVLSADIVATASAGFEVSSDGAAFGSSATFTQSGGSASGTLSIRLAASAAVSGSYNSKNIVLSSTGATSINITTPASGNTVSAKSLTVSGLTGANKVYDRTTSATLSGTAAYVGLVNGDNLSVTGTPLASFATATVGNNKPISVTGYTDPSANYTVTQPTGLSANITAKPLTLTGVSANDKIYDGTRAATFTATLNGVVSPDAVTLNVAGNFDNAYQTITLGIPASVTPSFTISGNDSSNYSLDTSSLSATYPANISPKALTISNPIANNKLYDGNTDAIITGTLVGVTASNVDNINAAPDVVSLGYVYDSASSHIYGETASYGTFASANVGTNIVVTPHWFINGDTYNYTLTQPSGTLTANISSPSAPSITSSANASETYGVAATNYQITVDTLPNGITIASYGAIGLPNGLSVNGATGLISGTPTAIGTFNVTLSATDNLGSSGYLTLVYTISPKAITLTNVVANNKEYDGSTAATFSATLNGVVSGDSVTFTATGTFDNASVGNNIPVTFVSGSLNSSNYSIDTSSISGLTANITKRTLSFTASAANKVYNATNAATVTVSNLATLVGSEIATLSATGTFADSNVGTGKTVTVNYSLGGADAANYQLPTSLPVVTADITAKPLTFTIVANNKEYDGSTTATVTISGITGFVGSDASTVVITAATPTFASANVGTGISVSTTLSLSGTNSGNYSISQSSGLTATIFNALGAGDVAVIGYNTSGAPDSISLLVLSDLTEGMTFYVNDNELASTAATSFTDLAEMEASFTVKSGQTVSAGTVLVLPWGAAAVSTTTYDWSSTTSAGLGASNDEVYIYTAPSITSTTPTHFIYYAQLGTSTSSVPSTLTSSTTAIHPLDAASRYSTTCATYNSCKATLLTEIGKTATNWNTTGATSQAVSDWSFTVAASCATATMSASGTLSSLTAEYGSNSTTTSFTINVSLLVAGSTVTVTAPAGFEVSTNSASGFANSITFTPCSTTNPTIYVQLANNINVGNYSGTISISSSGASSISIITHATNSVTPKPLTISGILIGTKIEDGTTNGVITGTAVLNGVLPADTTNVTLVASGATATFSQATAGTNIPVTVAGYTLSGSAAANYSLTQPTGLTGTISNVATPVITSALTLSAVYGDAATYQITATSNASYPVTGYNATNLPAGLSIDTNTGIISGSSTAVAGTYNIVISATNAGGTSNSTLVFTITKRALTVVVSAPSKIYDALTTATIAVTTINNKAFSDTVTITGGGTFDTKIVGTNKTVTAALVLDATSLTKYTLTQPTIINGVITAKALTLSAVVAQNKVFDGTTTANITATLGGVISPDAVTFSGTGTFASSAIGIGVAVTSTSTLAGTDAGNYSFTQPTGLTANITDQILYLNTFTGASACPTNGNVPTMTTDATGAALTRSTITCNQTANVFNSTTLNNTATINTASYIEFSASTSGGKKLNVTGLYFFRQASNTAPNQLEVRYSTDNFTTYTTWGAAPVTPTAGTGITWDFTDFKTPVDGTVKFRLYPYGTTRADLGASASATGTFRLDDVTIYGTVIYGPSASSIAVSGNATICSGTSGAIKTTITGGVSPYTVVYNNGTSNTTVSNYTSGSDIAVTPASTTTYSLISVTDANGLTSSNLTGTATITVNATSVAGTASGSTTICSGSGATVTLSGNTGTIQWQQSANGTSGWTDISGATSASLNTGNLTATTYYQAIVTSGVCPPATSNMITVTVNPTSVAGSVTSNTIICSGTGITVSVSGSTGTIQWQQSADGSTNWTDISGATSASYATGNLTSTTYYHAVVTSGVCPAATTSSVRVQVNANVTYYADADHDGYGNAAVSQVSCMGAPSGYVADNTDCDDNRASTHPGAVDICSDGIDNDCNGTIDNVGMPGGCAPVVSYVIPSMCGATLNSIDDQVYAALIANVQGYRWKVTKVISGTPSTNPSDVQMLDTPLRAFRITQLASYAYATTYQVEVAVKLNNNWQPYYGTACTITTPAPATTLINSQCGATLNLIDDQVLANIVSYAQGYRWRITKMVNGTPSTNSSDIQTIDTSLRAFKFTQLTSYAFATSYQVEVAVKANNNWMSFGSACTITTPSPTTSVTNAQCGVTLTLMTDVVYANLVSYATGYRFKVTNIATSAVQTIDRSAREFRFNLLSNIPYNTLFKVEVAVKNTDGSYLPYGNSCNITTPAFPTTSLQDSQCDYSASSNNEMVYAKLVSNATNYRFNFTNSALSYGYTFDTVLRSFALNTVPGLIPNTTYSVKVMVKIGGVWGNYSKVCTLTTPGTSKPITAITSTETNFDATAYPNPFAANFKLNVTTTSAEALQVKVYDMLGKLIENSVIDPIEVRGFEVGNNYPSGVYNVIVSQGDNIKTLRVIKR